MLGETDLDVFYDPDDFGIRLRRHRLGVAPRDFVGILSTVDWDGLDSHVLAAQHMLSYPTRAVDIQAGDQIELLSHRFDHPHGTKWRVLDAPQRQTDGLETGVVLGALT